MASGEEAGVVQVGFDDERGFGFGAAAVFDVEIAYFIAPVLEGGTIGPRFEPGCDVVLAERGGGEVADSCEEFEVTRGDGGHLRTALVRRESPELGTDYTDYWNITSFRRGNAGPFRGAKWAGNTKGTM